VDPFHGSAPSTRFCNDLPHGRGAKQIVRSNKVVRMPLSFLSVQEGVDSNPGHAHHIFRLLGQERRGARAIFVLDILLDEPHLVSCTKITGLGLFPYNHVVNYKIEDHHMSMGSKYPSVGTPLRVRVG